jgi:Cft2 family RNA processing exonuclease
MSITYSKDEKRTVTITNQNTESPLDKIKYLESRIKVLETEIKDRHEAEQVALKELFDSDEHIKVLEGKYNELIFAVHNKYPNESRHETTLRYIRNAENPTDNMVHQAVLVEVK